MGWIYHRNNHDYQYGQQSGQLRLVNTSVADYIRSSSFEIHDRYNVIGSEDDVDFLEQFMTRDIYKFRKEELGWALKPTLRNKAIKRLQDMISDPNSSDRSVNIAIKNLAMLNAQNIDLYNDNPNNNQNIQIVIKDETNKDIPSAS